MYIICVSLKFSFIIYLSTFFLKSLSPPNLNLMGYFMNFLQDIYFATRSLGDDTFILSQGCFYIMAKIKGWSQTNTKVLIDI